MHVEYAFLADAADAPEQGGKLYVLGAGIEEIRARRFPTTHPYMSFVVKIGLHPTECDRKHRLEIELWDPDGRMVVGHLKGEFTAGRHGRDPTRPVFIQMVLSLIGTQFEQPGTYSFHIIVNGQHMKTVLLYVEQIAPPGDSEAGEEAAV